MSFFCTKIHKWRGSYQRIVTVSEDGIATFSSEKNCITNFWSWKEVEDIGIELSNKSEFILVVRDGKWVSSGCVTHRLRNRYHFRCCLTPELVCEVRSHLTTIASSTPYVFSGYKVRQRNTDKPVEFVICKGYLQIHCVKGLGFML